MNASLLDLEQELTIVRDSLSFLNRYAYEAALLDVTRYCAYVCSVELSRVPDAISDKHEHDKYVEACIKVINWLPRDGLRLSYRRIRDKFNPIRVDDCRKAFQIAHDQAFALDAVQLVAEGLYECSSANQALEFKPLSESVLWFRGQLDLRNREREMLEAVRTGASPHERADLAADLLLDSINFVPESLVVKDYSLGQLKAIVKALFKATYIWYVSRPHIVPGSYPKSMWRDLTRIFTRTELVATLSRETGEKRDIVRSVVDDLTFVKTSASRCDSNAHLLLALGTEHVIIQPDLVLGNNIGTNIPRIWKRANPEGYSRVVGSRIFEDGFIERIKQIVSPVADARFVATNQKLPSGEVDLAVLDRKHESLLIIEVKNVTPPDSIRDRRNAFEQAIHGRNQVKKLIEWIGMNTSVAAQRLFGTDQALTRLKEIFGAVVCNSTYGDDESETEIPIFNQYLLMDYFDKNPSLPSLKGLIQWQTELKKNIPRATVTTEEIQIGKCRLIVPLVKQF